MASAWGKSWGSSWGNAWGVVASSPVLLPQEVHPGRRTQHPVDHRVRNDDDEVISIAIRMLAEMPWL